uniref:AlNc14C96G5865 protein n=1 Tax=Albugo laibachii Nc14 TaxID=890382 RepID=F0WGY9_9STRA|nr:AlNc14C96G5865 [Albugo laibachii Nc14]|eukprot:CCA20504.1 AlNc14C96G5865 [Albugo laibachii Nc14]
MRQEKRWRFTPSQPSRVPKVSQLVSGVGKVLGCKDATNIGLASQLGQLAVGGITAQAREPLKNPALIKKKASNSKLGKEQDISQVLQLPRSRRLVNLEALVI